MYTHRELILKFEIVIYDVENFNSISRGPIKTGTGTESNFSNDKSIETSVAVCFIATTRILLW